MFILKRNRLKDGYLHDSNCLNRVGVLEGQGGSWWEQAAARWTLVRRNENMFPLEGPSALQQISQRACQISALEDTQKSPRQSTEQHDLALESALF